MDKGILWIVFLWLIVSIIWFGRKYIKEKKSEINYINILKSMKKDKKKHSNGRFKW